MSFWQSFRAAVYVGLQAAQQAISVSDLEAQIALSRGQALSRALAQNSPPALSPSALAAAAASRGIQLPANQQVHCVQSLGCISQRNTTANSRGRAQKARACMLISQQALEPPSIPPDLLAHCCSL